VAGIDSISLSRGPCYGTCPVYRVTLRSDGTVIWEGERFVQPIGRHVGRVDPAHFEHLARLTESSGFFEWRDEYAEPVTDHPANTIEVHRGNDLKRVVQYATDEPPGFWTIATLIDGIALHGGWQPASADPS
jgi:hypothetical protein